MERIADYEFVRPLGSGNHGHYYLARRPARLPVADELVAVKVLAGGSTPDTFRRAARELAAFAAVQSPYLVSLYDAGRQHGVFYYAGEYLPGGSLADAAAGTDVLRAVGHAASAAAALHAAGIAHRDIKPGNVLLHDSGAKLSDLGLSHVFTSGLTLTGMGELSAVEYADPDVLHGERPGPEADVWSLGVLLHRVVTGRGVYGELPQGNGLLALRKVLVSKPEIAESPVAGLVAECLAPATERITAAALAARLLQ
ncbi:protein kinase domain-containing protein [Longispora albida]|uniref:protein kinase domain-containing protein n=1 Tax=Longispora albida TaxID=203523 RepID=UPI00036B6B74|nr:protein kinase [Longispora albida]